MNLELTQPSPAELKALIESEILDTVRNSTARFFQQTGLQVSNISVTFGVPIYTEKVGSWIGVDALLHPCEATQVRVYI